MSHPAENPVLSAWTGPYGGAPPFDKIRTEHFPPALDAAIAEKRADVAAIAANPQPATFANTLEALEASGPQLAQAVKLLQVYTSTMNDQAMRLVQTAFAPKLAALADEITHNQALYARVAAVFEARERAGLDAEQQRLAFVIHDRFVRRGAGLDAAAKARLQAINQELASLQTRFSQNVLADEEGEALVLDSAADLDGLSPQQIEAAAATATARGLPGKWAIANTRSAMDPFLTYSARRDLREKALKLWQARGAGDNRPIMTEILKLRAEKARLLGHPTFAHWIADGQMAKTPEAALKLLTDIWHPATARVREEAAEMAEVAVAEGANASIAPFDYRHYAEKVRKAKYAYDETEVKPYLQLTKMVEAMFWAAGELFGLRFTQVHDLPVYHPDVVVYEATRDGERIGLFYFDFYARPGKSSGAWMNEYRTQQRLGGVAVTPIISNNENYLKGAAGEPTLISWTDAVTLFHEFGHGLHGLNSDVTYPSLAGTAVLRDFVELPSQLFEHWLPTRELLGRFALHYRTGEPMPKALVDKILRAQAFRQGFQTAEYLSNAIIDLKAHLAGDTAIDPAAFEAQVLSEIGMPTEMVLRHPLAAFTHMFASESYAAGYYNYIWADTLTADAAEAFAAAPGGFYDKDLARRLLDGVLSIGNKRDPGDAFRDFRGRDATVDALMRDRGFAAPLEA
ncbi:MAG TPA: M3 family metallopeptidase [Aliidongia sp.]|uniref:M3 family metallopeptidase n=1 Tax=Aliidongia sp. TaxID=1914230 RepID=UPI002DDD8A26|nr:M3 family metallopeptidase [Aliidongia sp.]HEV2675143.1 M3 family metallopeptidase [Aliidongia sp.]